MTKHYERIQDGITTHVAAQEALDEGRAAMLDRVTVREFVRKISEDSGRYDITYKDGRHVVLRPIDVKSEPVESPRVGERVTYKVGRRKVNATVTRRANENEEGQVGIVNDGDQTGSVRYVAPMLLTVHGPDLDKLHGDAIHEDQLRTELATARTAADLPKGTRVVSPEGRMGTVNGVDVGRVTVPGHVNYGREYVGVNWDAVEGDKGLNRRSRPFVDELRVAPVEAPDVPEQVPGTLVDPWTWVRRPMR